MEGVDHIHIVQICRSRLVSDVHGVFQGQIPDREGLKLCVSGLLSALVVVVELTQTGRHFSATGTRRGDDHERA